MHVNKNEPGELIIIGELARKCRISTKTLRYYNKVGLLKPVFVDPETGYRYYNKEQLYWVTMIKRLKYRGFSIKEIINFMNAKEVSEINGIYHEKVSEIEAKIEQLNNAKELLNQKISFFNNLSENSNIKKETPKEVVLKEISERPVVFIREKNYFNLETLSESLNKIQLLRERYNLKSKGVGMSIFYDDYFLSRDIIDFEVASILENKRADNKFTRIIPSGIYATIIHRGSRDSSKEYYKYLINWISANGYKIAGPTIKIYLFSFAHSKSSENVICEFQIMVSKI